MINDPGPSELVRAERLARYATHPAAIRVFQGYRRPDLAPAEFLHEVGQTFMPGTPYMLSPLGCAAYLPGVVVPEDPLLPSEFALIAYPSREVWQHASATTLRGRVYTQTHAAVYDGRSHAAFPVLIGSATESTPEAYFAFDRVSDWQTGTTVVLLASAQAQKPGQLAGAETVAELRRATPELDASGVDQVIVLCGPTFVVTWIHVPAGKSSLTAPVGRIIEVTADLRATVQARPIPVRDEPPVLDLSKTAAYNFLFLRESRMFL